MQVERVVFSGKYAEIIIGIRSGSIIIKQPHVWPETARVAVMSYGLNRAGGGRPSFRATRARVREISPLVRRAVMLDFLWKSVGAPYWAASYDFFSTITN